MSKYLLPQKAMLNAIKNNSERILRPLCLASMIHSTQNARVPKEVKPLDLPDELPEEPTDLAEIAELIQNQYLTNYFGDDLEGNEEELASKLISNTDEGREDAPISSLPAMLGEGLGSMVNNPKFARMCNPVDTEFEINVCDELANLLNLHEDFLYSRNGVGIINANEGDSVLSLIITAKFLKRSLQGEAIATSDKYIVYASNREVMSGIKRICQTCDVTLRIFNNLEELTKMIEDDKLENLHPLFILYDLYFGNQEKYENETEKIGEICKNDNIWFHINLGHYGCFAMLDECKYLTQDSKNIVDSFSIEASKYFEVSYESSILWSKNRDRIYEGMHWSTECEQKFQYLSDKHTYTVDFKNFQVYLGKMNRAYKFWFVLNMYGINAMKDKMAEHFENFKESSK